MYEVHELYEERKPTPDTAIKLFRDEWVSALPGYESGTAGLFEDSRVTWAIQGAGGMNDKTILELGPLEGGHTYMLSQAGAASVTAIEAYSRCYLKCLVVKEVYNLNNVHFLFGNFVPWLQEKPRQYDYIHAAGVLYHMVDPVGLLNLLCKASRQIYIWTHYVDLEAMPEDDPRYVSGIVGVETATAHGREYQLYRRRYLGDPTTDPKFCGGVHKSPAWIERAMILHVLHRHGFKTQVEHSNPLHQNGPCCSILALKI